MIYDVIVVGAGPAGAAVARHTARQGLKTILLDKGRFPRYKPCGGGVTPGVGRLVDTDYHESIEREATGIIVYSANEQRYMFDPPQFCLELVSRERFDQCLVAAAIEEGAQFIEGVTVRDLLLQDKCAIVRAAEGGSWCGRIIVGADGANSRVARLAGLDTPIGGAAIEVELQPQYKGLPDGFSSRVVVGFDDRLQGYGWVFPKNGHLSVGVGAFLSKNGVYHWGDALERFIARFAFLKDARVIRRQGWPLPIHKREHTVNSERVCLVGDAAALVDPFTGEGIYYAILSGILAAEAIQRDLSATGSLTNAYSREVRCRIMQNFQSAALVSNMFYRNPTVFLKLGRFADLFSSIVQKKQNYLSLLAHIAPGVSYDPELPAAVTNRIGDWKPQI